MSCCQGRSACDIVLTNPRLHPSCTPHTQVLRLLTELSATLAQPDWVDVCQCLMFLGDSAQVATILDKLLRGSEVRHCTWSVLVTSKPQVRQQQGVSCCLFLYG